MRRSFFRAFPKKATPCSVTHRVLSLTLKFVVTTLMKMAVILAYLE